MKLIFLDFDGVLNSDKWKRSDLFDIRFIDQRAINRIINLLKKTNARIVISSNWRWANALPTLQNLLEEFGIPHQLVIGATPWLPTEIRGKEIETFIKTTAFLKRNLESFVIFDDAEDMGCLDHRLVRTTMECGLLDEHIDKALKILDIPWEPELELE